MAVKIQLLRNGMLKEGYVGFSYTTAIFSFWVPLFRGDWQYFLLFLLGHILTTSISVYTVWIPNTLLTIYFGYIYNRIYTTNLLNQGYKPRDTFAKCMLNLNGYMLYDDLNINECMTQQSLVNSEEKNKMILFIIYKFAWIILLVLGLGVLFLALLALDVPY